jgi:nitroreductase
MRNSTAAASGAATRTYDAADLRHAAEAGVRAPSLHNSQPWLFALRHGAIEIRIDPERRLATGRSGWAARMACGAATYNARLALAAASMPAVIRFRYGTPGHPTQRRDVADVLA